MAETKLKNQGIKGGELIFCGSYLAFGATSSTSLAVVTGADGQSLTALIPVKKPVGKKLYIYVACRVSITNAKYLYFEFSGFATSEIKFLGTGSNANYNSGWKEVTDVIADGDIRDLVAYYKVDSGGSASAMGRATLMIKYDD